MYVVVRKLKVLKSHLKQFNKSRFADIENTYGVALRNLEFIQSRLADQSVSAEWMDKERAAAIEVLQLQEACRLFLSQKAKMAWAKDGDHNSKYFHNVIKGRFQQNQVSVVKDSKGIVCSDPEQIQGAFLSYYKELLGTKVSTDEVNSDIVQFGTTCSDLHKSLLLRSVTKQEIKEIIFSIPDAKSPGPDGYSSAFFKDSWNVIGDEICLAVMDAYNSGGILKQLNATSLVLIPKCSRPENVTQFRPIACCNVLYKVLSKLICARLSEVLPDIISRNQSGFIKGRSIIENVLICQDLVRLYTRKSCSPRCLFKMDLMKAYDSVSWEFVEGLLTAFDFPVQFRGLIMRCITTASYSLVLNGDSFGFFQGKRGLRQGDPMSPLIFTLCMEYFSRILKCATDRMKFSYHPLCKPLKLTHLMFADELLLFSKGDGVSIMVLLRAFASFSAASGLKMSAAKTNVYFNGVKADVRHEILSVSGVKEGTLPFRYLGVPITAGRLKWRDCSVLIDKVVARIRSLGARKLSYAGRLVIVKSVLATLHNYWAMMFILPKGVLNRINTICRNFLWDGGVEGHRVPLVAWARVCTPKREGGLGIIDSDVWNRAAVGKLVWWIAMKADRLWVQWVHHVYMKSSTWLLYQPPADTCWYWRKVCQVKETLKDQFNEDGWLGLTSNYSIRQCYMWLTGRGTQIAWYKTVWSALIIPKHAYIGWLIQCRALPLKDKLFSFGVCEDNLCSICALQIETYEHLFLHCVYCQKIVGGIFHWLGVDLGDADWLMAIPRRRWLRMKKRVTCVALLACWYTIWMVRNRVRFDCRVEHPWFVIREIKMYVRTRINTFDSIRWSHRELEWWSTK